MRGADWWISRFALALCAGFILALFVLIPVARAAPLKVYSHPANLYAGNLTITRIYGNLTVRKPTTATVYVNGEGRYHDDGDHPQYWHVKLHAGRNHFKRTFFVRHWDFKTVPSDHWVASRVYRVFVGLTLGGVTAHG